MLPWFLPFQVPTWEERGAPEKGATPYTSSILLIPRAESRRAYSRHALRDRLPDNWERSPDNTEPIPDNWERRGSTISTAYGFSRQPDMGGFRGVHDKGNLFRP